MELLPAHATEIVIPVCAAVGIAFSVSLLLGSRDSKVPLEMGGLEPDEAQCEQIRKYVSEGFDAYIVQLAKCEPQWIPYRLLSCSSGGVNAFLAMEWWFVAVFIVGFAMLVFLLLGYVDRFSGHSRPCDFAIAVSFLLGALTSAFSSFLGMKIALYASAWTGLKNAKGSFHAAFRNGAAMGFLLAAIGLLGLYIAIIMFKRYYGNDWEGLFEAITGYSLGASSMAFFGRTGGGIYAKAADVCHHLVDKHSHDYLPMSRQDQSPTVITYNVGDVVGDIAGTGTDLFGAALVAVSISSFGIGNDFTAMCYPLLISSMGILVCFITTLVGETRPAINQRRDQLIISTILMSGGIVSLNWIALPSLFKIDDFKSGKDVKNWQLSLCVGVGLWAGPIVWSFPGHYSSGAISSRRDVIPNEAASNLVPGFGVLRWIFIPVYADISIVVSFCFAATYGIALAALGMLSIIPTRLAIDAHDHIRRYAKRIAQMALGEDLNLVEDLDTKAPAASGKGFAIESTALVSIALFGAFARRAKVSFAFWDFHTLEAAVGFILGNLLPRKFSDMTMRSVGRAGMRMAEKSQNGHAGLNMDLESQNGHTYYIKFPTDEFLWGLIGPGALVMLTPVIVGTFFGADALFGILAGSLSSVLQIAVSPSDADGASNKANISIKDGASEYARTHLPIESTLHNAVGSGDTVGDPWKDISGPPLNILVQLMALESLVFAPFFASHGGLLLKFL